MDWRSDLSPCLWVWGVEFQLKGAYIYLIHMHSEYANCPFARTHKTLILRTLGIWGRASHLYLSQKLPGYLLLLTT